MENFIFLYSHFFILFSFKLICYIIKKMHERLKKKRYNRVIIDLGLGIFLVH